MRRTYTDFLSDLTAETCWSTADAERFASSVIATLEERVSDARFEAQLPSRLRRRLRLEDIGKPDRDMTYDEFLGRVATRAGEPVDDVVPIVRMVFRALRAQLDTAQAHHVEAQLPDDLRRLWNPPPFGRR